MQIITRHAIIVQHTRVRFLLYKSNLDQRGKYSACFGREVEPHRSAIRIDKCHH